MTSLSALKQCPANWRHQHIRVSEIGGMFPLILSFVACSDHEYSAPGEEGSYMCRPTFFELFVLKSRSLHHREELVQLNTGARRLYNPSDFQTLMSFSESIIHDPRYLKSCTLSMFAPATDFRLWEHSVVLMYSVLLSLQ